LNVVAGFALALIALSLSACSEVEEGSSGGYEPATLESVEGSDSKRVRFTAEGAERTGLRTAKVRQRGRHRVVPYASLLYDAVGKVYVYTSPRPLTFDRVQVQVGRIERDRVLLTEGPPAGSDVVTAEVYGTELDIAGGH
jgi:hypothetical protein